MKKNLFFLIAFFLFLPVASAQNGIERVVEGKYIVQMSATPVAAFPDERVDFVFSFNDLQGILLTKPLNAKLIVRKRSDEPALYETDVQTITNSVTTLNYPFLEARTYLIVVEFTFPDEPEKLFHADFPYEVKAVPPQSIFSGTNIFYLVVSFLLGWIVARTVQLTRRGRSLSR